MSKLATKDIIVEIADQLFYQQGYQHTSFADISNEVGISRGNFYHHFKSKDDILDAVIQRRLANTEKMLNDWQEDEQTSLEQIRCFINILIMNRAKIKLYGCPVGTLTTELAKLDHPSLIDANKVFSLFADWLEKRFLDLGQKENAKELALHLLARSQGIATIASAFQDETVLYREVETLNEWLTTYS
ncbi:TetR/AcrR family transcriptional regulator [Aliikangiella coralliicola]|uniref:TetR/AcrR family transcriptional regulator n=1 Tax=Aliikangiella coralliicola TaxID=2592383 RepID=A0A545UAQ3_9GAMM|nr:TetR/AcrR family transcriptional regulator [Aliikangiella coralliicola]TQV86546.1 TetR/AcrR family transcriptional regulator [Aliikangiella coralliicola]